MRSFLWPPAFMVASLCALTASACRFPNDGALTLTDVQLRGTHNSYHIAPADPFTPSIAFTQEPLDVQLRALGVRQLELDLHKRIGGTIEVFHIPGLDEDSRCFTLQACLEQIAAFSRDQPTHLPILIWLEPKDLEVLDTTLEPLLPFHDLVEQIVRGVFPGDEVITPAEVQGASTSLRAAIRKDGWPTLARLRGRVMFALLDQADHRTSYLANRTLEHLLFAQASTGDEDFAAMLKIDDVRSEPGVARARVADGFLVTSTADEAGVDDAENTARRADTLAAGAHYLSSDAPDSLDIGARGASARCNPVHTSVSCAPEDLE